MADRLSTLDASFLYLEDECTPMHVGEVAIFRRPKNGFDYDRLVELIERRLPLVPRYRQKVRYVPGSIARPVWVDDAHFDVAYHVRRSALPKPGDREQLHDLVARLMSRPLDHSRPLWEIYLVEGLAGNRAAVITKTHLAAVDGSSALEIGQVLLDSSEEPRESPEDLWVPEGEPTDFSLIAGALSEVARRPSELVRMARDFGVDTAAALGKITNSLGGLASALRVTTSPAPVSPLNVRISPQRRFAVACVKMDEFRAIRKAHGGTINDAVLTVITGALRNWLLSRGETVVTGTSIRAMTPMSIQRAAAINNPAPKPDAPAEVGVVSEVSAHLVDLPIGEPNPIVRLHQVSHATLVSRQARHFVAAKTLLRASGFAPPTLHTLGARAASSFSKRLFNVVVTNVPGQQIPLYAAGAKMTEVFPVMPLAKNQALAIGVTSYDGGVYFGLNADRDALSDVNVLAVMIQESLEELREAVAQ